MCDVDVGLVFIWALKFSAWRESTRCRFVVKFRAGRRHVLLQVGTVLGLAVGLFYCRLGLF